MYYSYFTPKQSWINNYMVNLLFPLGFHIIPLRLKIFYDHPIISLENSVFLFHIWWHELPQWNFMSVFLGRFWKGWILSILLIKYELEKIIIWVWYQVPPITYHWNLESYIISLQLSFIYTYFKYNNRCFPSFP